MARKAGKPPQMAESDGLLRFVRFPLFVSRWEKYKLTEEECRRLELAIMEAPRRGTVIPGAGGLRKLRFALPRENRGKSGSYRIFYAYFFGSGIVALASVLAKGEAEDLSQEEIRAFGRIIPGIEADLLELDRKLAKEEGR